MFNRSFQTLARAAKSTLAIAAAMCLITEASAQMAANQLIAVVDHAPPTKIVYYAPGASSKTNIQPTYARTAKKLSAAFEGYAIQLAETDFPLSRENALFRQFGRVFFERGENGKYRYLILAPNFSSKKAVEGFIDQIIKRRAPDAMAVEFKMGSRK